MEGFEGFSPRDPQGFADEQWYWRPPRAETPADELEQIRRALVWTARRDEARAVSLNAHLHRHIDDLRAELTSVWWVAAAALTYGVIGVWLYGVLADRMDALEKGAGKPQAAGVYGAN